MTKKKIVRIGFFVALFLLCIVGYISMGGLSESRVTTQENNNYLMYGKLFKGSAKTDLGQEFKLVDSLVNPFKDYGDLAGYFYTNPSKKNGYQVEVFVGISLQEKLDEEIEGFEYRSFNINKSVLGEQDAFFLFSTLYNDIFQYAKSNGYVLDSVQSFERYPSDDKTIIEIPFKGEIITD